MLRKGPGNPEAFENRIIFRDWSRLRNFDEWARVLDDPALAALVALLETYGRFAFDTDEVKAEAVRRSCTEWIGNVVGERRPPGNGPGDGSVDWDGLGEYFKEQRRHERQYVVRTMSDFRALVWDFIRELGETVTEDRDRHSEIRERLQDVEESVRTQPLAELRARVLHAIQRIGRVMEERERKQVRQMHQLGAKLREMRAELVSVRIQMAMDPLTEVYNRSSFDAQLAKFVQLHQFSGTGACLFILDGDSFKSINDNLGHRAGDTALKMLADCCIRSFPRESDFIARYGGDEFAIIVEEATPEVARLMARRLLDAIASTPIKAGEEPVFITASLGVALLEPSDSPHSWFERADRALREAKALGRNQLVLASTEEHEGAGNPPSRESGSEPAVESTR